VARTYFNEASREGFACDNVSDDAEFAGCAQFGEAFGNAGRIGRYGTHSFLGNKRELVFKNLFAFCSNNQRRVIELRP